MLHLFLTFNFSEEFTQPQTQNVFIQHILFYLYIKCNFISDIKQNNIGLGDMQ